MVSNPRAHWGPSMDTQEISRDAPKPAASGETPAEPKPVSAAEATPRMALACVPLPAAEPPTSETIVLAKVEAPRITPDIDEIKPAAAEPPTDTASEKTAPEPPAASAPPRVSRFTLL